MWSARLATFIAGVLLMAVPAVAVKFEDHGGLTIPRHMPPNALKFSHAPTGIPGARVIPAAMTFSDRPSLNHHRTAAPAHRPMRFADRPGFNLRQIAVAPITRTSTRFEERPGLNLRPVAARLVAPLTFTDYCAGTANCGHSDV